MPPQEHIRFGPFELDLQTGELRSDGRLLRLSPKPCRALALLAKAPGRLVTREMLRQELWDSDTHVDFEHVINFCIREIRTALGDNAKKPCYIETLPRRGYRFIAETSGAEVHSPRPEQGTEFSDTSPELEAYRHYESARKLFRQSGKEALENARQEFKRSLEILPGYALAHSGLGAACALCSLNRRHPEDLEEAEFHLMKALDLDRELAEPYPWLCYVLMRKNRFEEAVRMGLRGVQLQPDLVSAHYFLGLAYFAGAETDSARFQPAAAHLRDAIRTDPQWQPTWFVLSQLAVLVGDYGLAEYYAGRLLDFGNEAKGHRFIGAEITLGSVWLRRGDWAQARDHVLAFLERMADSDHMYRDAMSAVAACVLGDIEIRRGEVAAALAAYRRGWHTVQEFPRIAAYQRVAARAQAGLAAAYASTGERGRAEDLLCRALQTARDSESMEHSAAAATMPDLYWGIASAWARLGSAARALEALESAVRTGWRDPAWLERDPEFRGLRGDPGFKRLVEYVRSWPGVRFDEGELSANTAGAAGSGV